MPTASDSPAPVPSRLPPILTLPHSTHTLSLRLFHPTDSPSITSHANNPTIARNLPHFPNPYTLADADWWCTFTNNPQKWLAVSHPPSQQRQHSEANAKRVPGKYAIIVDGAAVGAIGLNYTGEKDSLSLEYWISESLWGRGIMTAVVEGFVGWVFGMFAWVGRVEGCVAVGNAGSRGVLRGCGFVEVGKRTEGEGKEVVVFEKWRDGVEANGVNT